MNPQNNNYNSGSGYENSTPPTASTDPYAFMAAYDVPVQPPKNTKKKLVIISISILVLMFAAVVAFLFLQKGTPTSTANTLKTDEYGNLQIAYPNDWNVVDEENLPSNFVGGFTGTSPAAGTLYYGSEGVMEEEIPVKDFDEAAQKTITDGIVANVQTAAGEKSVCVDGFELIAQKTFSNSISFGIDLDYSCAENIVGSSFVEKTRYIYIGDGLLYQVSITALPDVVEKNGTVFDTLLKNVLPKQQKS